MPAIALVALLAHVAAALLLARGYFRRYAIPRPPIGVLNRGDIALMSAGIIVVPNLYLLLPRWLVVGMFVVEVAGALYFTVEPVMRRAGVRWLLTLGLLGADCAVAWRYGAASGPGLAANNVVLLVVAVGIANLWAQGGLRARDLALLAAFLTAYDVVATARLALMGDLFDRLATLPLAPLLGWPTDRAGHWLALGFGDLLVATAFPLVLHKAYGRAAGLVAMLLSALGIGVLLALVTFGIVTVIVPVMIVLGPLMVLAIAFFAVRHGPERTTAQFRRAEPLAGPAAARG